MSRNTTFDFKGQFPRLSPYTNKHHNVFRKEISLLCIVGVIGCLGTLFIFNKAWFKDSPHGIDQLNCITIAADKSTTSERQNEALLHVDGAMIVNSKIDFTINNYNPNADYEIRFGDGQKEVLLSNHVAHSYLVDGDYQVELTMLFKDQETIVYHSNLKIKGNQSPMLSGL